MKIVGLILVYLAVGSAVIVGAALWLARPIPAGTTSVDTVAFTYPTVVPPTGADSADWKAGHLDGWKWCAQHIREQTVVRDDAELRGFCPPNANRTAAFLTGYHAARAIFDGMIARDGADEARTAVLRQIKANPKLHDLRVVALPP